MTRRAVVWMAFSILISTMAWGAPKQQVDMWVARDVVPGPKIGLSLNTRNIAQLHLTAYRLEPAALLVARSEKPIRPSLPKTSVRAWTVSMVSKGEHYPSTQQDIYRSRRVNLPPLSPGVYLIVAKGDGAEAWAVVNITHLAVVVKRAHRQALVWVNDAHSGQPLKGASVTLYDRHLKPITHAVTREDGTALLTAGPGMYQTMLVTRGKDVAGIPVAVTSPDGLLKAHFQTDRPVYRPGQTILFKVILRRTQGQGYAALANTICHLEARDPKDNVLWEKTATSNAMGTVSEEFEIPAEGMVGPYTIVAKVGDAAAYETVSVAEYRKPEFKVTAAPEQTRYLAGEEAAFEVQAAYYFGAPAPQAQVRYQIRRDTNAYSEGDDSADWYASDDGNLYPRDTYAYSPFVAEGTVYTDDAGKVRIPVKTEKAAPDSVYHLSLIVQDASRRQVEASASVLVYAANVRIALSTEVLVAPLGSNIPVRITVVDLDSKPVPAQVTLTVKQPVWEEKQGRYRYRELTRTTAAVPARSSAQVLLPAAAQGTLLITAAAPDGAGRTANAEMSVWVAGPFTKAEVAGKEPRVQLRLAQTNYQPGDTVTAYVTTNVPDRPLFLTVEGGDLWQHSVVRVGKKPFIWKVKTSLAMSPNIYLSAEQWVRGRLVSATTLVALPDLTQKLDVTIEPEQSAYRPGDLARYTIHTTGHDGKPVSAEVAVTVVDEAIYALRPDATRDLYTAYWGLRENYVITNQSAPEEVSGGAYQRVNELAPVRQRFLDTAYWNAHVMTNADGLATVSFEMPGNLTTWRAIGRVVTEDTRVGAGKSFVQVSRPVMLRLATPRQLVVGDRLVLIGTVTNRSDKPHEFETALSAQGIRLEGDAIPRVTVPAGGEGTVSWSLVADTLPESGEAFVTGRTLATDAPPDQGPEYSDALRLPVRIAPAGVADRIVTSGVLANEETVTVILPTDRIEPATAMTVMIRVGLKQAVAAVVSQVLSMGRYGSPGAADHLSAAAALGPDAPAREVRESLALLSRTQLPGGAWGWWEDQPADPVITAHVMLAVSEAQGTGVATPQNMLARSFYGAVQLYNDTNLWEHRALLASALALAGFREAPERLDEVHRRGMNLSPYALALLARAYAHAGHPDWAQQTVTQVLANAVVGPRVAYVPAGEHPGWSATTVETTAQTLLVLLDLKQDPPLQTKLAQWLAEPQRDMWWNQTETAAAAIALAAYLRRHPQPEQVGSVGIAVNDAPVPIASLPSGIVQATVPRSLLRDTNTIVLRREGEGEAFYTIETRVFRPAEGQVAPGLTVLRRYEVQNAAGLWDEVQGPIKPADPLRTTVLVWPDDRPDALRIVEPIPAGFEFIDSEDTAGAREEVRDAAVVHYVRATGVPFYFRYYLRAESEGSMLALPAQAEALLRPALRGATNLTQVEVQE